MKWEIVGPVLTGLAALLGGVRQFTGKSARLRSRVNQDLELHSRLSKEDHGDAHRALREHIKRSVKLYVELEETRDTRRTDWFGVFLGLIIMVFGVGVIWWTAGQDLPGIAKFGAGVLGASVGLFGLAGLFASVNKKPKN